jgi:hypothetical protein
MVYAYILPILRILFNAGPLFLGGSANIKKTSEDSELFLYFSILTCCPLLVASGKCNRLRACLNPFIALSDVPVFQADKNKLKRRFATREYCNTI